MSSLENRFGANGRAGEYGENAFYSAFQNSGLMGQGRYSIYRSAGVPDVPTPNQTDVDFTILNAGLIQMIDVKNARVPGAVLCNTADGTLVDAFGEPINVQPSKGLDIAMDRWSEALPDAAILDPIVVFASTSRTDYLTNADFSQARWNGHRIFTVSQALTYLVEKLGRPAPVLAQHRDFVLRMIEKKKADDHRSHAGLTKRIQQEEQR
jgi:hypothetical protein